MKICYIADASTTHAQKWVRYFAGQGHEVHLISGTPLGNGNIGRAKFYRIKGFSRRVKIMSYIINSFPYMIQIRNLLKKIKPDILHAHYITDNGFLGALSGFHPLVLSAWGSDILIEPKRFRLLKMLLTYTLKKADMITTDGENTIEEMLKMGVDPERIHLIYHGVDTRLFKPGPKNEILIKKLGISESPVIISTRTLRHICNVETVVKSAPLVLKEFPEAIFLIAGDGNQREYLKEMARSLSVLEYIRFIGMISQDELPDYLILGDVYVSTSLSDGGLSVSLAEAMSCGLPSVVTDVGDNREWIEDGKNGFVVPTQNPELLAEKINHLLRNKDLRKESGVINRRLVEEKANYEKEMGKLGLLYEELIQRD